MQQRTELFFTKPTKEFKPKAPGMKYRHYAPSADYTIYKGDEVKVAEKIIELANEKADEGKIDRNYNSRPAFAYVPGKTKQEY